MHYDGKGAPKDLEKALHWYTKAAEQGDVGVQSKLGVLYSTGEEVPKDLKKAVHWFTKAAEQSDAGAQHMLGVIYYAGEGVPRNDIQAYAWCNVAAAQGVEHAAEIRDILEKQMTASQREKAQALSNEYYDKYVK